MRLAEALPHGRWPEHAVQHHGQITCLRKDYTVACQEYLLVMLASRYFICPKGIRAANKYKYKVATAANGKRGKPRY
jgi:hypothetical protein